MRLKKSSEDGGIPSHQKLSRKWRIKKGELRASELGEVAENFQKFRGRQSSSH